MLTGQNYLNNGNPIKEFLNGERIDSQYRPVRLQMVGGEKVGEGEYVCSVGYVVNNWVPSSLR